MTDPKCDFKRLLIWGCLITLWITIGCFMGSVVKSFSLPSEAIGYLTAISIAVLAILKEASGFEFGSSRGSQQKDDTAAKIAETAKTVAETEKLAKATDAPPIPVKIDQTNGDPVPVTEVPKSEEPKP